MSETQKRRLHWVAWACFALALVYFSYVSAQIFSEHQVSRVIVKNQGSDDPEQTYCYDHSDGTTRSCFAWISNPAGDTDEKMTFGVSNASDTPSDPTCANFTSTPYNLCTANDFMPRELFLWEGCTSAGAAVDGIITPAQTLRLDDCNVITLAAGATPIEEIDTCDANTDNRKLLIKCGNNVAQPAIRDSDISAFGDANINSRGNFNCATVEDNIELICDGDSGEWHEAGRTSIEVRPGAQRFDCGDVSVPGSGVGDLNECGNRVNFTNGGSAVVTTINSCDSTTVGWDLMVTCDSGMTLNDGGGNIELSTREDGCANTEVQLICNGTNWIEVADNVFDTPLTIQGDGSEDINLIFDDNGTQSIFGWDESTGNMLWDSAGGIEAYANKTSGGDTFLFRTGINGVNEMEFDSSGNLDVDGFVRAGTSLISVGGTLNLFDQVTSPGSGAPGSSDCNESGELGDIYFRTDSNSAANTIQVPTSYSLYMPKNQQNLDEAWLGSFEQYATAQTVNSGSSPSVTNGISKLFVVLNTCSDSAGSITVTGTSVDRDDQSETGSDTDVLTISGTTTDSSTTDAESNDIHRFTNGYVTSKWFRGSVTLSTSDVDCTDVDVWGVSFTQFDDQSGITVKTFDWFEFINNTAGWTYVYLYEIDVTGDAADITDFASVEITAAQSEANKAYRRREGNIDLAVDGTSDGFWVEMHLGPSAVQRHENITALLYYDQTVSTNDGGVYLYVCEDDGAGGYQWAEK